MEEQHFKSLLSQVTTLNNHYKKINDLTGENFNVFRILKLEASEVRMHSAMIGSLLDPNGSHGQKDSFLKLFVKHFCFKQKVLDTSTCKIEIERHVGFISSDGTEGGRIDILITDKSGNQILVENKIHAGDQKHQLLRYYNYSPNADLIYLTLDGKLPNEDSFVTLSNDTHFKCYSYKSNVIKWLEDCRKEATIYPIVRESITQYINLIKYLTNQTLNNTMQVELNKLLLENLEASFTIADSLDQTLNTLLIDQFTPKLVAACEALGLHCINTINMDKNYTGIWISNEQWRYVKIGFQFQNYDKEMIYGFLCKENPTKNPIPDNIKKPIMAIAKTSLKPNAWWPVHYEMEEPLDNWDKFQAWKAIEDGSMLNSMVDKIRYLLKATDGLTL